MVVFTTTRVGTIFLRNCPTFKLSCWRTAQNGYHNDVCRDIWSPWIEGWEWRDDVRHWRKEHPVFHFGCVAFAAKGLYRFKRSTIAHDNFFGVNPSPSVGLGAYLEGFGRGIFFKKSSHPWASSQRAEQVVNLFSKCLIASLLVRSSVRRFWWHLLPKTVCRYERNLARQGGTIVHL